MCLGDVDVLRTPQPLDQAVLLVDQRREVDRTGRGRGAGEGTVQSVLTLAADRQQCLAGDTADVEARPSDDAAFDQHHPGPDTAGVDASGHGSAAGADNDEVNVISHGETVELPLHWKVKA